MMPGAERSRAVSRGSGARPPDPPALSAVGLGKRFGATVALDDVSVAVAAGEVHVVVGENGAGKSTLARCLAGLERPDSGTLLVDGSPVRVRDARQARALGIGMVHQHFTLAPGLTGAENLVLGRADLPAMIGWRRERARLDALLARLPFRVPLDRPVATLSAGEKQKLEILQALRLGGRILILDEPTSVLTPDEAGEVLGLLRGLARRGEASVLMISHRLREVAAFADTVTVLRRGRRVGGGRIGDVPSAAMSRMAIGDAPLRPRAARLPRQDGAAVLRLAGLTADDEDGRAALRDVSLDVGAGEILGIAGVAGNGQAALVEVLSGQRPLRAGRITVRGRPFEPIRRDVARFGVRILPEEPLRNAAVPDMSVAENLALRAFDQAPMARFGWWLRPRRIRKHAAELVARSAIRTASLDAPLATLSGGTVQRAVLARELSGKVDVLIAANPCAGLDVRAVAEFRAEIVARRNRGAAMLLLSEDLDEILDLADRVAVMSRGRIVYTASIGDTDRGTIGKHMTG